MAGYPGDSTNKITVTEAANFIPELWSDEVLGGYKGNLVLANLITKINHVGKAGDTIHIPVPARNAANIFPLATADGVTAVTINTDTASKVSVLIDQRYEWSMLIDDAAEVQALDSMRRFYTDDAGYAMAQMVDWHLHAQATGWAGGTVDSTPGDPGANLVYGTGTVIGSDGSTAWDLTGAGNGAALTDLGIRTMIQTLDDNDVPLSDRALVVPPVEKKNLLGLSRFTEQAFIGEGGAANSIRSGLIGDVYGIPVYVSTQCGHCVDTGGTNAYRAGLIFHKGVMALAEQMAVRTQVQYKQEFLADLFTADMLFGVKNLRPATSGLAFIVPA